MPAVPPQLQLFLHVPGGPPIGSQVMVRARSAPATALVDGVIAITVWELEKSMNELATSINSAQETELHNRIQALNTRLEMLNEIRRMALNIMFGRDLRSHDRL